MKVGSITPGLMLALAFSALSALSEASAEESYTLRGYRYGHGQISAKAIADLDERVGRLTLTTTSKQDPTPETRTFTGRLIRVSETLVMLHAQRVRPVTVGIGGKLEGRVASGERTDSIRAVFNPKAQTLGVFLFRRGAGGKAFRSHLTGLQDLGFSGSTVPRNHSPATEPVALVRMFLDKEYPASVAKRDAEEALSRPSDYGPRALGRLTVFVAGLFNRSPAPGVVFRVARHTDRVLITHANHSDPSQNAIRVVTELEGIPVPEEMAGRILEVGSREPTLRSWLHVADLLVEQLELLRQREDLLGFSLLEADATLISHSQGGLATVRVREAFEALGFEGVIGRLVALAPPSKGLDFTGAQAASWVVDPSSGNVHAAMKDLTQARVFALLGDPSTRPRWDLSLCGSRVDKDGDGLVSLASARFGARLFAIAGSLDHGQIFRRASVIDQILERLHE